MRKRIPANKPAPDLEAITKVYDAWVASVMVFMTAAAVEWLKTNHAYTEEQAQIFSGYLTEVTIQYLQTLSHTAHNIQFTADEIDRLIRAELERVKKG